MALMDWLSIAFAIFLVWLVVVVLFTPAINYRLSHRTSVHDAGFLYTIQSTCQAMPHGGNRVEIFTNGPAFYPAMLEAIRGATHSVIMELYIFQPGKIADQFVEALSDRARHGVNVTIVVDALGSLSLRGRPVRRLRKAGCRIESYQQFRWYSLARLNNRTHRELLVVDGRVAFAGGAGIADWWAIGRKRQRHWRDTMARIEGPVVAALQGVAAENWLECCGEILTGPEYFPALAESGETTAFVVKSSPVRSRHDLARGLSAADRRRRSGGPHQHAVLSARPRAAAGARRDRVARRPGVDRPPRADDRSALGTLRQPPHVGRVCSRPASASTNTAAR